MSAKNKKASQVYNATVDEEENAAKASKMCM